jgi:hypothetical protein
MSEKMVYQLQDENQEVSLCFNDDAYLNLKDFRDKKHFHTVVMGIPCSTIPRSRQGGGRRL